MTNTGDFHTQGAPKMDPNSGDFGRTLKLDPFAGGIPFNGILGRTGLIQVACMDYIGKRSLGPTLRSDPGSLDQHAMSLVRRTPGKGSHFWATLEGSWGRFRL